MYQIYLKMELIGREEEIATFDFCMEAQESKLIAVYGRRRVGKTFLIRKYFSKKLCFEISAFKNGSTAEQLLHFSNTIAQNGYLPATINPPNTWMQAFDLLGFYINTLKKQKKKVIFIDEMPWFDTPKAKFLMAFENFWNSYCTKRDDIVVIICGSAASWIINKVLQNKGGLHNRVSEKMRLKPFTLYETREFLKGKNIQWAEYDMAQLYMVTGGIPFYIDAVRKGECVMQFIERACFKENGVLTKEFEELYGSLFENAELHYQMVALLAKHTKGLSREEIISDSRFSSGGGLSKVLDELEASGFIRMSFPFGTSQTKAIYVLDDFFTLFYFKFMQKSKVTKLGTWESIFNNPSWVIWAGFAFERICIYHIRQIKKALGLEVIASNNSPWRGKGESETSAQIDLLIDRADRIVNLCEIKFAKGTYTIDKAYAQQLRDKIQIYTSQLKSKRSVFLTFISTFGLAKNEYYLELVQNQVVLKDLFKK